MIFRCISSYFREGFHANAGSWLGFDSFEVTQSGGATGLHQSTNRDDGERVDDGVIYC